MAPFLDVLKWTRIGNVAAAVTLVVVAAAWPGPARAGQIVGDGSLGDYTGFIGVSGQTATTAVITVTLNNTSNTSNGGYITGFVFNNPDSTSGGDITSVTSYSATDTDFTLLAPNAPNFGAISGEPYGQFDIGAAVGGDFLGGGNPTVGIPTGIAPANSATFTFNVEGTNLLNLSQSSLEAAFSTGGSSSAFFLVRFRGFNDQGSDKVPATPGVTPVPEPATLLPAVLAVACLGAGGVWRRRTAINRE